MPKASKKSKKASKRLLRELATGEKLKLHETDVLLGRGNGIATFTGNANFRKIVWMYKEEYTRAYRSEKTSIAKKVIAEIVSLDPPGRFLEKAEDGSYYVEVDKKHALEKTCQALRERKNKAPEGLESLIAIQKKIRKDKSLKKKKKFPQAKSQDLDSMKEGEDTIETKDSKQKTLPPSTPTKRQNTPLRLRISAKKVAPIKKKRSTIKKKKKAVPKRKSVRAEDEKVTHKPESICAKDEKVTPEPESIRAEDKKPTGKVTAKELFAEENLPLAPVDSAPFSMEEINSAANNLSSVEQRLEVIEKAAPPQESVPTESNPTDIDDLFSVLPPHLTAFFSGIYSNDLRDVNAEHPGALLPSKLESIGASTFGDSGGKTDKRIIGLESPSTVAEFHQPPQLNTTHSLFLEDEEMNDGKVGGPFKSWTDINIDGSSHSLLN